MTDERASQTRQSTLTEESGDCVHDTYVQALHHGNEEIPANAECVSVVNFEMYGIQSVTKTQYDSLAPPEDLFTDFRETKNKLESEGLDPIAAHNNAWEETRFEERYRSYLKTGWEEHTDVRDECERILATLTDRPVAVVCYEAEEKHCHRHILKQFLNTKHTDSTDNHE